MTHQEIRSLYKIPFVKDAVRCIIEYMKETNTTSLDDDDYKEKLIKTLFNTELKFECECCCLQYIDNQAPMIFAIIDYVNDRNDEYDNTHYNNLVKYFNLMWYFTGEELVNSNTYMELIAIYNESDDSSDSEDECEKVKITQ